MNRIDEIEAAMRMIDSGHSGSRFNDDRTDDDTRWLIAEVRRLEDEVRRLSARVEKADAEVAFFKAFVSDLGLLERSSDRCDYAVSNGMDSRTGVEDGDWCDEIAIKDGACWLHRGWREVLAKERADDALADAPEPPTSIESTT